mmetsp:Transcript_16283/g.50219  ORF Transcript_16283/g.50219 Transcript_16283/m.50219 type:complete len:261 (-) Transcript_16283:181-963(-)
MSREETMPTMRQSSSEERKMRWSFEASRRCASTCRESSLSTETTLNRHNRCCRSILPRLSETMLARHSMKSLTEPSRTANWPRLSTHLRSATEMTFIDTTPPRSPESSRDVAGQMVRCEEAMMRSASDTASSLCTDTSSIVSLRSKVRAARDFSTAVGSVNLSARCRKSRQEKTWSTSPRASTMGTRRTGAPDWLLLSRVMSLSTSQSGVPAATGTNSEWLEQSASEPTAIELTRAIASESLMLPAARAVMFTSLWLMSM